MSLILGTLHKIGYSFWEWKAEVALEEGIARTYSWIERQVKDWKGHTGEAGK